MPHHTLHAIPIHVIRYEGDLVGQRFGVSYNSSATSWQRCMQRNRLRDLINTGGTVIRHDRQCLCLASDVTSRQDDTFAEIGRAFAAPFRDPVIFDRKPGRVVIKNFGIDSTGDDRGFDVLCVVSHGYLSPQDPDRSGLLLESNIALSQGFTERTTVFEGVRYGFRDLPFEPVPQEFHVADISRAELLSLRELKASYACTHELVALLGCSTGVGTLFSNDDYNTLAYQWLKAGAVSVIASTWALDADIARAWAKSFVANWEGKGYAKAIAWRNANRSVAAELGQSNDFTWAVLSLFGDWL